MMKGLLDLLLMKKINLIGQRFGRLLVISEADRDKQQRVKWLCRCDCGVEKVVQGRDLRRGKTKSCGCLNREVSAERNTTHGLCRTPDYQAWCAAKWRCTNPNNKHYANYGGRGIEFKFPDFETFLDHIGPKPSKAHSLDRIDNNGHYEPGNIRWALIKAQARNKRSNHMISYQGETLCIAEWAEKLGFKRTLIFCRLYKGWSVEKTLETPPRPISPSA